MQSSWTLCTFFFVYSSDVFNFSTVRSSGAWKFRASCSLFIFSSSRLHWLFF
uniref:Uncharacterized protein n=1 Tax=Arundo donax TaxID=35708 RepID=A0A0A9AK98_ARUDO